MKKKTRLAFAQLQEELQIISASELATYQGGDGIDGFCLFYAMGYLSNGAHDENYYLTKYTQANGLSGLFDASGHVLGVTPGNASYFVASNFTASSLNPNGGIQYALNNGMRVLTDIYISPNTSHAVIITGVLSSGLYSYYDPQNHTDGIISASGIAGNILLGVN